MSGYRPSAQEMHPWSPDQRRRTVQRAGHGWGTTTLIAVAALLAGVGGTLGYGRVKARVSGSPLDAQAARLTQDLHVQLSPAVFSGGSKEGSLHTEGDFTALVQRDGGLVLSFGRDAGGRDAGGQGAGGTGQAGATHAADVMLGLEPPVSGAPSYVASGSADVRCYHVAFRDYASAMPVASAIACPAARPDGKPGSVQAWAGGLYAALPQGVVSSPARYPQGRAGILRFLRGGFPASGDVVPGDGLTVAAYRDGNGTCFYVRLSAPSAASAGEAAERWLAPAMAQSSSCTGNDALAASGLYGINAAREG